MSKGKGFIAACVACASLACGGSPFTVAADPSPDAGARPELAQVPPEASTSDVADPPDAADDVGRLGVAVHEGGAEAVLEASAVEPPLDGFPDLVVASEASSPPSYAGVDTAAEASADAGSPNPNASVYCTGRSCAGCAPSRFVVVCEGTACVCCVDEAGLQGCSLN
jgi:hypothetical protein